MTTYCTQCGENGHVAGRCPNPPKGEKGDKFCASCGTNLSARERERERRRRYMREYRRE